MKWPIHLHKSKGTSDQTATTGQRPSGIPHNAIRQTPLSSPRISESWRKIRLTLIDRYIIRKFIGTFLFSLLLIIAIVIVFDFNERIDKFSQSHAPWQMIVQYYINFVPYFVNLLSSLFVFISVIFFTSKLADNSEIIAMRSNGMSFKRLLKPYMISAGLIAIASFLLGSYIIPRANEKRIEFENKYIKKQQITEVANVQLQVSPGVIAFIQSFNINTRSGINFSLDRFEGKKLVSHLTASRIQYDTLSDVRYKWKIYNYHIRKLNGMRETITNGSQLDTLVSMEPSDLLYTRNQQETMTTPDIKEYIAKQRERGAASISAFEVEYYKRFASPFAAFILTFIGVSLSCEKKKGGMGLSLGIGLALSFAYIMFSTVSSTLAINANFPPLLAVWIPNILFVFISLFLYRRTPK
ncbi:MAG: LptF/LptG family permease [Prevotellaceae bacterium]|nr:LptF/LptG family permease [Prevotellaceae bacterium]MDY3856683.1 LptF/LptG family permease [Bacteroidaceae bacterium]